MSLQVWLPLTKDLRQQGLSSMTVENHNATLNTAGKLGSCYYFNGNQQWLQLSNNLGNFYNNDWSVACWLKPTDSTRSIILSEYSGTGASNVAIELTTARIVRLYWNGSPDISFSTAGALPLNEWTHLVMTKQGRIVKLYFNGELKQIYTNSSDFSTRISACQPRIGDDYRGNSGNSVSYQGYMNDFRMYDHCLSPMEVKELAKGLVLHYPLNRQGWGQNNLIITNSMAPISGTSGWSSAGTGWANSNVISSGASNGHAIRCTYSGTSQTSGGIHHPTGVDKTTLTTGAIYTLSARIRASKACIATFHNELMTTNNTINLTTDWKIYSYSCKIDNTRSYHSNVIYVRAADATQNMWIECDWIKLEEGAKSTPWIPNSAETLYTTMGLNSTTEYDCSGFCNNGTRTGTFDWTSDTPKYNVSLDVTTDSCSRYIYGPAQTQLTDQITLACWLYQTSATATSGGNSTTNQFALSQGRDYLNLGFNITVNNGKPGVYAGNGGSESGARVSLISTTKTITGSWHHVAATYNNGALKLYVDGQLDRETTIGALDYVDAPALVIGKMAYGYTNATSYFPFVGYISDARVYATALSADDVKSLYQNCATIDPDGTIRGQIRS